MLHRPSIEFSQILGLDLEFCVFEISGVRLHYAKTGVGPPVILLHGINIGWGQWYPNLRFLAQHFTVYAIDLPGAGFSSHIDVNIKDFKNQFIYPLEHFIRSLSGSQVHLIGHSIGAWIAISIALRNSVSLGGVVASAPLGFTKKLPLRFYPVSIPLSARFLAKRVVPRNHQGMRSFFESALVNTGGLSSEFLSYYCDSLTVREQFAHPLLSMMHLSVPFRFSHLLSFDGSYFDRGSILIVAGALDRLVPVEDLKGIFDPSQMKVYPQSGHVPGFEEPVQFNNDVLEFLTNLTV